MNNSSLLKSVCLIAMLSMGQLAAQEQHEEKPSRFDYYATHLITGGVADAVSVATVVGGMFTGLAAGCIAAESSRSIPSSLGIAVVPVCASIVAAAALMYNTPRWTDKYILQLIRERSRKQNILIFLSRRFMVYPLGVIVGEYLLNRKECAYARPGQASAKNIEHDEMVATNS